MTDPRQNHLSAEDMDALLERSPSEAIVVHLAQCPACRDLAKADRAVVRALEALPPLVPSAEFVDRVMARVTVRQAMPARSIVKPRALLGGRRAMLRAASVAVILFGAMTTSVLWTLANRDLLSSWGSQLLTTLTGWFWLGLRTAAANVTAQPWYGSVRDLLGSPGRLGITVALLSVVYVAGLLALRRLVALPSRPMPHANW
jgi:anti-sigma factor RsiW